MQPPSIRTIDIWAFLTCCVLLIVAAYLQIYIGLKPCPLCVLQRLVLLLIGLIFMLGALLPLKQFGHQILHFIIFIFSTIGAVLASRQVWLEFQPINTVSGCGANLSYLFKLLPMNEALKAIFNGTGSCATVTWRFLNHSIPEWTLLAFALFALLALWQSSRKM